MSSFMMTLRKTDWGDSKYFDWFDKNAHVTGEADEACMDALKNLAVSGIFPSYLLGSTGISTLTRMMRIKPAS